MRLTTFHSQYRVIGVNYNQVVKHLKTAFRRKYSLHCYTIWKRQWEN